MAQIALKALLINPLLILISFALAFILMPWVPLHAYISNIAYEYLTFSQVVELTTSFDGTEAPEAYDMLIDTVMLLIYVIICGLLYSIIKTIFNRIKHKTRISLRDFIKLSALRVLKPIFLLIITETVLYFFPNKIVGINDHPPYWLIAVMFILILSVSSIIYFSLKQIIKKGL